MLTALDAIRKEAREAHALQQYSVAERHYRTLLDAEACLDDVINLGALLRSQGRLREGSLFIRNGSSILVQKNDCCSMHAIAGMTATKRNWFFKL